MGDNSDTEENQLLENPAEEVEPGVSEFQPKVAEHPFICSFENCAKSYSKMSHLRRHIETHEGGLRCIIDDCDKIFISKATLKKHIDNIHYKKNPKKYKCSLCSEEFNKHNWLQRHMYRHTGVMPHVCPIEDCGKRFLMPSKLKRHLLSHEGYICPRPGCDEKFPKWVVLMKHIKLAHPKIHKCADCGKQFTTSYNLKAHSQVHKSDRTVFLCPVSNCSRFYTMKRNLIHHMKSYHEKRPFQCEEDQCYRFFKTEADLKAHQSHHDPNKRLRKRRKKKKKRNKLSFAAKLAGLTGKEIMHEPHGDTAEQQKLGDNSEFISVVENTNENANSKDMETAEEIQRSDSSDIIRILEENDCSGEQEFLNAQHTKEILILFSSCATHGGNSNFIDEKSQKIEDYNIIEQYGSTDIYNLLQIITERHKETRETPTKLELIERTA